MNIKQMTAIFQIPKLRKELRKELQTDIKICCYGKVYSQSKRQKNLFKGKGKVILTTII